MQKHISITDCSRNDTISKCMENFLDKKFKNCNTEMFNNYSCPLTDLLERSYAAFELRIAGYQQVVDVTGCKLPCTRYGYELTTGKTMIYRVAVLDPLVFACALPKNQWI